MTQRQKFTRTLLASTLALNLAAVQLPAQAAMITTEALATTVALEQQRDQLTQRLLRDDVRQQLQTLDVNPADVEARIQSMTPSELAQLQGKLDQMPAGGGFLGTLALILVIFLILDLGGITDIFPAI